MTYADAVEAVLLAHGYVAPLKTLYERVWDFKDRSTVVGKTPDFTIQALVQRDPRFTRVGSGVYALTAYLDQIAYSAVAKTASSKDSKKQIAFDPKDLVDERKRVNALIVQRQGQPAFRSSLLNAYDGTCAVTGCRVEPILEAAHIVPYLGPATNHIQNGLLLRADIHTLFDLQYLAVEPESRLIHLAPELLQSEYAPWHKQPLRLPVAAEHHPAVEALVAHFARCQRLR
jgi:hypothetical protein